MLEIINQYNLKDVFRYLNPDARRYTWRRRNPIKQARLDYYIVSNAFTDLISTCNIIPGYRSDHSIMKMNIQLSHFKRGKGIWKFNCNLLTNASYVSLVNETINEVKSEYTVPVYSHQFLKTASDSEIEFTIDEDLLLELILYKIRIKSIKFAATLKKKQDDLEQDLIKQISVAEKAETLDNFQHIENLKTQLTKTREEKHKGHMVRSRVQWLQSGEKPTQFFCSLERKNFIDKTIRKISLDNGEVLTDQSKILSQIKEFYSVLFRNKDSDLQDVDLSEVIKNDGVIRLTKTQAMSLEGPVTLSELGNALKSMKSNKTPGIDGFPSEFFKVFWCKLKYLTLRAFNLCYKKGILSVTLRQSIINCIPKGDKPRQYLKNWRPISLLCVLYKLLSTVIANRLKGVLDHIISKSQSGFIQGRNICEVTRLIYDIMNYTENNKIDGLLMLIDFEKAFDSISWLFLYKVLDYLGFTPGYVQWIKLLNKDIRATVIQAGVKSDYIKIERGCKQGDPIAAYLFILCAQILTYLIEQNQDIKGILIDKEIRLCQFADDTTLILDGSEKSLKAALNTIEIFGSFSGLKMNTSKTKVVWIGRKKHSKDKLNVSSKLDWGTTSFTLLGILFSSDLEKMPTLNYIKAMEKSKILINNWSKRLLTPLGKITVLKTFIISQFIHLLTILPSPSKQFIKNINELFFNFIWSNKPDKIKRIYLTQDYHEGGLKMVNFEHFIHSLKVSWIKKISTDQQKAYVPLFEKIMAPISKFLKLGPDFGRILIQKSKNPFWNEVIASWRKYLENDQIKSNEDIMSTPLWYNPVISKSELFLPKWYNKGIVTVGDILDMQGCVLDKKSLELKFQLPTLNFLDYHRVKTSTNTFVLKHKKENIFKALLPTIPKTLAFLIVNKNGNKGIYDKINKNYYDMAFKLKWEKILNIEISRASWKHIFSLCFKTIQDPFYKWFQYRILHRILGTQETLNKMGIAESPNCLICKNEVETIVHLFYHCPESRNLWHNLENKILYKTHFQVEFNCEDVILGYKHYNANSYAINTIIMITKSYIFSNSRKGYRTNLEDLLTKIVKVYEEQKLLALLEFTTNKFEKSWYQMKSLFT